MPKANPNAVNVAFQFEEGPAYVPSVLECLARTAYAAVRQAPQAADQFPFFESSKVGDWFSGKTLGAVPAGSDVPAPAKIRRLRAIKHDNVILLEHAYAPDGRIRSTTYADGEVLTYDCDDLGRITQVRTKSGRQTMLKFRPDDLLESVTYDNAQRFQYDYDANGTLTKLIYPDGVRSERTFTPERQLLSVNCGALRTDFQWADRGELTGYTLQGGSRIFEFKTKTRRQEYSLNPPVSAIVGVSDMAFHVLGAWRLRAEGRLEEMITPFGERCRVHASVKGLPTQVWSLAGQQRFDYDRNSLLSAKNHVNGMRSMVHILKDNSKALLVNPDGVALLEYDREGRLMKMRTGYGDYCLIKYSRCKLPKQYETSFGMEKITYDDGKCLNVLKILNGAACRLYWQQGFTLQKIVLEKMPTVETFPALLTAIWRWLAVRSTIRLGA